MSSCHDSKPIRTLLGLASLVSVQTSISARQSTKNNRFRSLIPVLSVAASQAQPSIPSSTNARTATASASMPKKTEDSILKHVQRVSTPPSYCWFAMTRWCCRMILFSLGRDRMLTFHRQLRKTRDAQARCKTALAFAKPAQAASRPARSRSVSKPASRIPLSSSATSSSSSAARSERSIDAHIGRVSHLFRSTTYTDVNIFLTDYESETEIFAPSFCSTLTSGIWQSQSSPATSHQGGVHRRDTRPCPDQWKAGAPFYRTPRPQGKTHSACFAVMPEDHGNEEQ